jgi:hypothetical protein
MPFGKDAAALKSAMSMTAAYLPQGGRREPLSVPPKTGCCSPRAGLYARVPTLQ